MVPRRHGCGSIIYKSTSPPLSAAAPFGLAMEERPTSSLSLCYSMPFSFQRTLLQQTAHETSRSHSISTHADLAAAAVAGEGSSRNHEARPVSALQLFCPPAKFPQILGYEHLTHCSVAASTHIPCLCDRHQTNTRRQRCLPARCMSTFVPHVVYPTADMPDRSRGKGA